MKTASRLFFSAKGWPRCLPCAPVKRALRARAENGERRRVLPGRDAVHPNRDTNFEVLARRIARAVLHAQGDDVNSPVLLVVAFGAQLHGPTVDCDEYVVDGIAVAGARGVVRLIAGDFLDDHVGYTKRRAIVADGGD